MTTLIGSEVFGKTVRRLTMAATGLATVVMLTVGFSGEAGATQYPDWWHDFGDYECYGHSAKAWHNAGYNVIFGTHANEETILGTD
ncbi:MAG: hypothetical protein ACREH3_09525, partial [Geminicoccales bacterium]